MPKVHAEFARSTMRTDKEKPRSRKAVLLLAVVTLLGLGGQTLFALDDPKQPSQPPEETPAPEDVVVTDEVLVIGEKEGPSTEMKEETVELLSVAGAANDPLQAIYSLPGVTFSTSDGPGGSGPVVRGSAPQDNAYFIDQIPVSYLFHLFGNSILDEHSISSFDLYPAAFSSKYGNATGGIVDVTLREPKMQNFTATAHTSLLSAGVLLETRIGKEQSLFATYRRSTFDLLVDEDDVNDEVGDGFRIDKLPISNDYHLKYSWRVNENNNLAFVAVGAADTLAATFAENNREALRDPDFAGPASLKQGFDSQGVTWDWQGKNRQFTSIFSHIQDRDSLIYGRNQHEKTDADRYRSRLSYWQSLSDRHSLSMGLSVEDISYDLDFNAKLVACNDLDPECSTVDAEYVTYKDTLDLLTREIYVEDKWFITEKQALTLGAHYGGDDYLNEGRVEPRLRYDYQINDRLSTYASAGQYSQLPQLREMIEVLGNPNLTTVKADHYVWGISHVLGRNWRWNADLYYKKLSDVVISSEQDGTAENYSNGAEGTAYGVEFLVKRNLVDRWHGWASLSLAKSDRTNSTTGETVNFEYDKPLLFNLVGNRLLGKSWTVGFRWNYQSGGRYTPIVDLVPSGTTPNILEPVYGQLNSEKYPDYHRLDLRAEYLRPKSWGHWKFYVDIINAYDQKNIASYEYAPDGEDLISPPAGYGRNVPVAREIQDGFFPSIGFEIRF
jgi:TonB-dependent Receptor Plug Domain